MSLQEQENVISVKDVNEMIRKIVTNAMSDFINVKGEISNMKVTNGNTYITLKDADASISAVAWKKPINVKNGDAVIVTGKITFFIKSGTYQITMHDAKKTGVGDLHTEYDKLKHLFESKGYFSRKRELPKNISRIGILTSLEGAALQDIMFVLAQNNYTGDVVIKNCSVQGSGCPESVKEGIKYFNKLHKKTPVDVLLIARGGGSFEDLMGYSSKDVVRSIYKSPIFTISAIGHEVDFMLSDFTADIRAPTPSIAGEMISHVEKAKTQRIYDIMQELGKVKMIIDGKIEIAYQSLNFEKQKYDTFDPTNLINGYLNKLENIRLHVFNNVHQKMATLRAELDKLERDNNNFDYKNVLKRGYVLLVNDVNDLIKTKSDYEKNIKKLKLIFADGEVIINNIQK